jgi:two-component system chemotaxis response regulator CheB
MNEILRINEKTEARPMPGAYRVMLVDDSSIVRGLIARAIEGHPQIQVVASAADGSIALSMFAKTPADVIMLDIEMPVMDGLTALPKLLAIDSAVKIIVASTLSLKNAEISLHALSLGAADYMPKPSSTREMTTTRDFKDELIEKILVLGAAARKAGVRGGNVPVGAPMIKSQEQQPVVAKNPTAKVAQAMPNTGIVAPSSPLRRPPTGTGKIVLRPAPKPNPDIILIGSSTGGPQALFRVIKELGQIKQPVMITQHMPPNFTTILAEHITKQCGVTCFEAKDKMPLEGGIYYVAPGDYHMLVQNQSGKPVLVLNKDTQENFCRPAVDPMLRSAIAVYGRKVLAVVLTGMGQDGWQGCEALVAAGGAVVGQDEATSVVWGMPGAVANAGLCSAVLPIDAIGAYVRRLAQGIAA